METNEPIEISVIMPTFNRYDELRRALNAFSHSTFSQAKFEVIVVDDGGSQPIAELQDLFSARINLTFLRQLNQGAAAARNFGVAHARGHFLVFTDDDCMPAPDWLAKIAQTLAQHPDCAIGGRTINALAQNPYSVASQLLIDYLYAYNAIDQERVSFLAGNHIACARSKFEELGGFDSTFTLSAAEDRDFCLRWTEAGNSLRLIDQAHVYHSHHLNFSSFIRQHFNYGRGAYNFHRREAQIRSAPMRIAPAMFYLNLICYPFGCARKNALGLAALLALCQVANALGFVREWGSSLQIDRRQTASISPSLTATAEP